VGDRDVRHNGDRLLGCDLDHYVRVHRRDHDHILHFIDHAQHHTVCLDDDKLNRYPNRERNCADPDRTSVHSYQYCHDHWSIAFDRD